VLAQYFASAPKNVQYTSNTIQDQIIGLIGKQIQATILNAIKSGGRLFSIIADECRDCSNKEQVVRYADAQSAVQEIFFAFLECNSGTKGEQIAELFKKNVA